MGRRPATTSPAEFRRVLPHESSPGRASTAAGIVLALAVAAVALLLSTHLLTGEARAVFAYKHANAQNCEDCHAAPEVTNDTCRACHTTKLSENARCWDHHDPGESMPAPTLENCVACHTANPHLGSQLGGQPACTTCHSTSPTPHHDGFEQNLPEACTDCHQVGTHNGVNCTNCHSETEHPSYPTVPDTCFQCHSSDTFGGRTECLSCHSADGEYAGQTDDDIHDPNIPDPPISATSCRSCHPSANNHAGQIQCVECHTQATPFHHNRAESPGYPACETCHGQKPQHGQGLDCTRCHQNAQHLAQPPMPAAGVCNFCHAPANFGVQDCYRCHKQPVYHAPHAVPGCTSHHSGYQVHDNLRSCESCHTNATRGHHVGSVVRPDCRSCHEQNYHVGSIGCQRCHTNAAHDSTPRNLPTPVWKVCLQCHPFAAKAPACNQCHDEVQHSATYRVPDDCTACHEDKVRHAGKVDCRLCHTRIESGHHNDGPVQARDCSECHVDAQVHASETAGGADFTCGVCHEGGVHGILTLPDQKRCLECHAEATEHSGGLECIQCHWPAAHAAAPVAGEFGSYEPLGLRLPDRTGDADVDERAEFAFTGFDLISQLALGLALLLMGFVLRTMSMNDPAPEGPGPDSASGASREPEAD